MFSYQIPLLYLSLLLLAVLFPLFIPIRYKWIVWIALSIITLALISIVVYAAYTGAGDWHEGTLIMDSLIVLPILGMISYSLKVLHACTKNQTLLYKTLTWGGVIVALVLLYFLHGLLLEFILWGR